jgi:hypothetical protein
MINDILQIFAAPRWPRFGRGHLNGRMVKDVFAKIREELGARTEHAEYRQRHIAIGVSRP